MEIKTISYKRTHNLGNYNSENLEMVAVLNIDDNVDQCAADLKEQVEKSLGIVKPSPAPKPVTPNYDHKPF